MECRYALVPSGVVTLISSEDSISPHSTARQHVASDLASLPRGHGIGMLARWLPLAVFLSGVAFAMWQRPAADRPATGPDPGEQPAGGRSIPFLGYQYIDDLPGLIDRSVQIDPLPGDF